MNYEKDKVLFVHIPKTAGTSVSNFLELNNMDQWVRKYNKYPRRHEPYFELKKNNIINEDVFSFSIVRNPYTRTYSCFNQYNKDHKTKISFIQYLNDIKNNVISPITPLLHLKQSFFITENNKILVNKIYKFENLKEFEQDFSCSLGFDHVGGYMVELYNKEYTTEAIDIVKLLYKEDFVNFDYSFYFKPRDI
jgi:hypothetical protein